MSAGTQPDNHLPGVSVGHQDHDSDTPGIEEIKDTATNQEDAPPQDDHDPKHATADGDTAVHQPSRTIPVPL